MGDSITANDADLLYKHTLSPNGDIWFIDELSFGYSRVLSPFWSQIHQCMKAFFVTSGKVGEHWCRGYS